MSDISAVVSTAVAAICASPLDDVLVVGAVSKVAPRWVGVAVAAVLFTVSAVDMGRRAWAWYSDDE